MVMYEKSELKELSKLVFRNTYININVFRLINFQNNSFIATFLYSTFTIWKRFWQPRLNHVSEVFLR